MKILNSSLETVCGITSVFPEHSAPEVAFAGKSNVGKSSLINGLMNRKNLARTSSEPGKTQTVNFYNINNGQMYFVDLPGYGYAKVSEKQREKWGKMIEKYLQNSPTLKQVLLLIDIRHKPGNNDKMMYDWIISNGFDPVIIATKHDKLKRSEVSKSLKLIASTLGEGKPVHIIPYSSVTKYGRDEILSLFDEFIEE